VREEEEKEGKESYLNLVGEEEEEDELLLPLRGGVSMEEEELGEMVLSWRGMNSSLIWKEATRKREEIKHQLSEPWRRRGAADEREERGGEWPATEAAWEQQSGCKGNVD